MIARKLGFAFVVGAALVASGLASCGVSVDLTDKTCPCPSDLVCDQASNRCVTTLLASSGTDGAAPGADSGAAEPPAPACTDTSCPCGVDADCKDPARRYCGPEKLCVECLATPTDTCTAGGYCNAAHQCAVGCKTVADCQAGQHCQTDGHRCVACVVDTDCGGGGKRCSQSGSCVDTCSTNGSPCGTGGTCCNQLCLSLTDDVFNCGQCGNICSTSNGSATCAASKCTWKCVDGYAHCKAPTDNTGCETSVRTVTNCGTCGTACTSQQVAFATGVACGGTACTYATCQPGHIDLDGNPANGCEAPCGGKNQICCPTGEACSGGNDCRANNTCPPN